LDLEVAGEDVIDHGDDRFTGNDMEQPQQATSAAPITKDALRD
jgi:hypothetical protein